MGGRNSFKVVNVIFFFGASHPHLVVWPNLGTNVINEAELDTAAHTSSSYFHLLCLLLRLAEVASYCFPAFLFWFFFKLSGIFVK